MRVRLGQTATVRLLSSDAVCTGARVVAIGSVVGRKVALDNDPVTDTDARVVEVRIALSDADSARFAGLVNARVSIVIADPQP
jgi:HlyD family secretion protein